MQSHTATQQWQSFELRMRKRRVERCLLRASVAMEAGVLDDAREALEEARRLTPNDPDVEHLTAELGRAETALAVEEAAPVPLIQVEHAASAPYRFAPAAMLVACVAVAGWWWSSMPGGVAHETAAQAESVSPAAADALPSQAVDPAVRVSETSVTAPIVNATAEAEPPETAATTGSARPADDPVALANPREVAIARSPDSVQRATIPVPNSRIELPNTTAETRSDRFAPPPSARISTSNLPGTPGSPVSSAPKLDPLPGLPETPAPTPRIVSGADGIAAFSAAARTPSPIAPAPAEPVASTPSDEQTIRAVLERYESAYSRLDAAAAGRVWPGVNQRALASAFQGLSSQTISLERCDVRVNGTSAHAECSGNARWTPKVGGGAQSAARHWRFDLRNAGGNWVITQATAR